MTGDATGSRAAAIPHTTIIGHDREWVEWLHRIAIDRGESYAGVADAAAGRAIEAYLRALENGAGDVV